MTISLLFAIAQFQFVLSANDRLVIRRFTQLDHRGFYSNYLYEYFNWGSFNKSLRDHFRVYKATFHCQWSFALFTDNHSQTTTMHWIYSHSFRERSPTDHRAQSRTEQNRTIAVITQNWRIDYFYWVNLMRLLRVLSQFFARHLNTHKHTPGIMIQSRRQPKCSPRAELGRRVHS